MKLPLTSIAATNSLLTLVVGLPPQPRLDLVFERPPGSFIQECILDQPVVEQPHRPANLTFRSVAISFGNQEGLRFKIKLEHLAGARPLLEGLRTPLDKSFPARSTVASPTPNSVVKL